MCEMNQPDNRLCAALRRLSAIAPRSAPPALGEMLKGEFRRHHLRRRRERNARILLAAACFAASVGAFLILRPRTPNTAAIHEPLQTALPSKANVSAGPTEPKPAQPRTVRSHVSNRTGKSPASAADRFVALPTFDPAIPIDHSEIVRVDLPGRALRLVGFPISEEFADRRVVADVVLAQDGTPYALRLVQNSPNKEQ
jgi:hypothetical protein